MMGKATKKKIVSFNFSHALFFWISLPLKFIPIGSPKTSVTNYHSMLRNISEERISHMIWWCGTCFGPLWSSSPLHTQIEEDWWLGRGMFHAQGKLGLHMQCCKTSEDFTPSPSTYSNTKKLITFFF